MANTRPKRFDLMMSFMLTRTLRDEWQRMVAERAEVEGKVYSSAQVLRSVMKAEIGRWDMTKGAKK